MNSDRRLVIGSIAGITALGAASAAAAKSSSRMPDLERAMQQTIAARQCANTMNRYEIYLAQAQLQQAVDLFDLTQPDVQADVGFGFYYGPESIKRLFLGLHGYLEGDANKGTQRNAALYIVTNTTEIIEVAADLKTAKGLWTGTTLSTPGNEKDGFHGRTGYARRVADFINVNGQWKLWHYFVYGLASAPVGKSWTDPEVYEANKKANIFPPEFAPDAPRSRGIGTDGSWRPNRPVNRVEVPVPYNTFSETFSYALK